MQVIFLLFSLPVLYGLWDISVTIFILFIIVIPVVTFLRVVLMLSLRLGKAKILMGSNTDSFLRVVIPRL